MSLGGSSAHARELQERAPCAAGLHDSLSPDSALAWGLASGQPDRHSLLLLTCTGMSTATELSTRHPAQQASRTPVSWPRPGAGPTPQEPGRHLLGRLTRSSLGKLLL